MNKSEIIPIKINNYNFETKTTNIDFLENEFDSDNQVFKNKLAVDLIHKNNLELQPLRLKVYIETCEEITDLEVLYQKAFEKIKIKQNDDILVLYKNMYKQQTFYTIEPLFKPRKLNWQF